MSLVTAAQKMCATRKYIAAAKIFTVVSALLVVREYARAAQSDRRVRVDSQTFTNQVTDSRRFDLSTWARELLRDVGPKANSDGIRVGLRYMQAEDKPFWMTVPYKIPLAAHDINEHVWDAGSFYVDTEAECARKIMSTFCNPAVLVLDVGANSGYFSLLAAASGCRAFAFEPVKDHVYFIELSAALNGFRDRLQVFNKIVSNTKNVIFNGWNAASSDMSFVANAEEHNKEKAGLAQSSMKQASADDAVAIDEVVKEDVLCMKVDVEGFEPSVFASAQNLIKDYTVRYILFEMTYYLYKWTDADYLMILESLDGYGYRLYHIEANHPIKNPQQTLPRGGSRLKAWFDKLKATCDTHATHFCQANIFAVHAQATWPV